MDRKDDRGIQMIVAAGSAADTDCSHPLTPRTVVQSKYVGDLVQELIKTPACTWSSPCIRAAATTVGTM